MAETKVTPNEIAPFRQTGVTTAATIAANGERTVSVTFPVAFTVVPKVIVSTNHRTGSGTNDYVSFVLTTASSVTTSGMTIYFKNFGSGTSGSGIFATWMAEI